MQLKPPNQTQTMSVPSSSLALMLFPSLNANNTPKASVMMRMSMGDDDHFSRVILMFFSSSIPLKKKN